MKITLSLVCAVLLAAAVFYGCQSVATTSAKLRNQEGNYELAIELSKKALQQNPNDAEAYFQLGVSYSELDSVGLAYDYFMKSMKLDPKKKKMVNDNIRHNYAKHYNLGQKAFNRQDLETSAKEFKMATDADPRQSIGYYNLGVAYSRLGDQDSTYLEKALTALDKVLELATPADKHYIDALKSTGRVLVKLGRVEEAVSKFNRLVEEDPTNYGVIEALGGESLKRKDWKAAAVFFDLAAKARAKIDAEDFKLYYNLGVANYNMAKQDPEAAMKAINYYKKALELQPDEPTTILNIVYAYYTLEDWQGIITWGEKYVALVPDGEKGWQFLSIAYTKIGDKEKARICSTKYEEIMKMKGKM
jgi:superkiller protein 3